MQNVNELLFSNNSFGHDTLTFRLFVNTVCLFIGKFHGFFGTKLGKRCLLFLITEQKGYVASTLPRLQFCVDDGIQSHVGIERVNIFSKH